MGNRLTSTTVAQGEVVVVVGLYQLVFFMNLR
jgi:hypothetical protein